MAREFLEAVESEHWLEDLAHETIARLKSSKDGKLIEIVCVGGYTIKPKGMTREQVLDLLAPPDPTQDFLNSQFLPGVDPAQAEESNRVYEAGGKESPPPENQIPVVCPGCDGTGIVPNDPEKTVCGICSGDKKIPKWAADNFRLLHPVDVTPTPDTKRAAE